MNRRPSLMRIKQYPQYLATPEGVIYTKIDGEIVKAPTQLINGYLVVIGKHGKPVQSVHRLVAIAFNMGTKLRRGSRYKRMDVHHINQIKLDNRADNLVFLSHSEHKKIHQNLPPAWEVVANSPEQQEAKKLLKRGWMPICVSMFLKMDINLVKSLVDEEVNQ